MQNRFYGDNRDIVKWSTLLHLCKKHGLNIIIQVAFFRDVKLTTSDGNVPIPEEVWNHFRDIRHICNLGRAANVSIVVFDEVFEERSKYIGAVLGQMERLKSEAKIVFLDPDTGIAPKTPGPEHVTQDEIHTIWSDLQKGDWLVLYQHRRRFETDWKQTTRKGFADGCQSGIAGVQVFSCPKVAPDVVLFGCAKR